MKRSDLPKDLQEAIRSYARPGRSTYRADFASALMALMPEWVPVSGQQTEWTSEMIETEALKYKTRLAFRKGSDMAYQAARKRGILDRVCAHMETVLTTWTVEAIQAEALKYRSRTEFARCSRRAYNAALYRGILDQVCAHMGQAQRAA